MLFNKSLKNYKKKKFDQNAAVYDLYIALPNGLKKNNWLVVTNQPTDLQMDGQTNK